MLPTLLLDICFWGVNATLASTAGNTRHVNNLCFLPQLNAHAELLLLPLALLSAAHLVWWQPALLVGPGKHTGEKTKHGEALIGYIIQAQTYTCCMHPLSWYCCSRSKRGCSSTMLSREPSCSDVLSRLLLLLQH